MSITDELRKWGRATLADTSLLVRMEAIADRIDAAVDGMIELPKDADGEYIHVGDVMENIVCPPVHREVTGVGVECFYGWDDGNGRYSQFDANCYRHHHAPTVEDVLDEFVARWMETHHDDIPALKAEYAAKLALRGEE